MKDAAAKQKFIRSRGLRFPLDPQVLSRRHRLLLRDDHYEQKESDAVLKTIKPDDRVIELGAGLGYMSTLITAKLGVRHYRAYEANPRMIPYIRAVHEANGIETVEVVNALLGAHNGSAEFYVRGEFDASSLQDNLGDRHGGVVAVEQVDVLDIRAVFQDFAPTALVCDIEGAEAEVLPKADLSGLRIAVVELHPQWIGQSGVQAVFDAMQGAGLSYFPKTSNAKVVTFRKGW